LGEEDYVAHSTRDSCLSISDNLAESDNPFMQAYAAELNKSATARLSFMSLQQKESLLSRSSQSYNPVKDAKFYLAEIEALAENTNADVNRPPTADQPNWRVMSNAIETDIEKARQRMMDCMKQQSARKVSNYAMDLTGAMPYSYPKSFDENCRYPPEYVSVEISSHGSSERHQMAMDEMQHTHDLEVADMQRALRSLQADKDDLLREKADNFHELRKAREDVNRLKAVLSDSGQHQGKISLDCGLKIQLLLLLLTYFILE
jgi:hypothetical protein